MRWSDLPGSERSRRFDGEDHGTAVSFFLIDYPDEGRGPELHRHAYDEVFVVAEGRARFTIDGGELVVGGGEIVVVPVRERRRRATADHDDPQLAQDRQRLPLAHAV